MSRILDQYQLCPRDTISHKLRTVWRSHLIILTADKKGRYFYPRNIFCNIKSITGHKIAIYYLGVCTGEAIYELTDELLTILFGNSEFSYEAIVEVGSSRRFF